MIKTVIRFENDMVAVFDERGEQMPDYQGHYFTAKDKILKDAPEDTLFQHSSWGPKFVAVSREEW